MAPNTENSISKSARGSGIQWRRDGLLMEPHKNGKISHLFHILDDNSNIARTSIYIPPEAMASPAAVRAYLTELCESPERLEQIVQQINSAARQTTRESETSIDLDFELGSFARQRKLRKRKEINQEFLNIIPKSAAELRNNILSALDILPTKMSFERLTSIQSRWEKHTISPEEFEDSRAILEEYFQFFPDLLMLLEKYNWPIHLVRDVPNAKDNIPTHSSAYAGLWISDELINYLRKRDFLSVEYLSAVTLIERSLYQAAYDALAINPRNIGIKGAEDWKRILEQQNAIHKIIKEKYPDTYQFLLASPSVNPAYAWYFINSVVSVVERFAEPSLAEELQRAAPDAIAFMRKINQRAHEEVSEYRLQNGIKEPDSDHRALLESYIGKNLAGGSPGEPSDNSSPALIASHVDLGAWSKRLPRPFTGMELETQFLRELQPRVAEALSATPPYNQVQVRMVHGVRRPDEAGGNHRIAENYRFVVLFRNAERNTLKPIELDTGTKDYHVASLLKGAIQSHLLNHPGMQPLYLPGITDKRDRPLSPTETVMPHWELGRVVQVPHEDGTLRARFTFLAPPAEAGGAPREVTAEVSLGLRHDPNNRHVIDEATRRMGWLEQRYRELLATDQWTTLGELVEGLKEHIHQHEAGLPEEKCFGWSRRKTLRLDVPKEGNLLAFPSKDASSSQSTTYGCPYVQYDEHQVNPTFIAYIPVAVKNGNEPPISHRLRINLHTSDDHEALERTAEALDKLKANMKQLADDCPHMYWEVAEHPNASGTGTYKTLKIVDVEGKHPPHPHPTHLEQVQDDLSSFRTGFHVVLRGEPKELGNGKLEIVLGIDRGEEANGDALPFRDVDREVFRHMVTIDASHREKLPEFLATIQTNFERVLRETYSTSEMINGELKRVRMQDFRPQTIRNCFITAVGMETPGEGQRATSGEHATRVRTGRAARQSRGWKQALKSVEDSTGNEMHR